MRRLLAIALFLLLAAPASATVLGFRDSSRLTPRMQALSGNPQAVVRCAQSWAAWEAAVKATFGPEARGTRVLAYTVYADHTAYVQQYHCVALEKWLRGKTVSRYDVGVAAHVIAHEAVHLSGVVDERQAECGSLRALPTTLSTRFGVKNPVAVKAMVAGAREKNRRSPLAC